MGEMSFVSSERARLSQLGGDSLFPDLRPSALAYFEKHGIAWWGGGPTPTESAISSQLACINHLEPARLDGDLALSLARNVVPDAVEVLPVEDSGFVAYEWVGARDYLGERGWSPDSRGKNITSVDALIAARTATKAVSLIVIEWKYTENYRPDRALAISTKGTSRVATYERLLEHPDCPIKLGEHERLFYDPFYQLMRQTLLAWRMVEHGEFGASGWQHVHVIPADNLALRNTVTAPGLTGSDMSSAWRSVLKEPERYHVLTPTDLVPSVSATSTQAEWRMWLRERYGT
jgi:hypothetical protein